MEAPDQREPDESDTGVGDDEVAAVERGDVDAPASADHASEAERAAQREEQASEG